MADSSAPFGTPAGYPTPPLQGEVEPPAPTSRRTNGFAVAALVLGIAAPCAAGLLGLLAVIFGIIALRQIKRRGDRGRGMAIGGLVAATAWIVLLGTVAAFTIGDRAERDASGQIIEGGEVEVESLTQGDCVEELPAADTDNLYELTAVPCAEPHEAQVFAVFELAQSEWPGETEVSGRADEECLDRLAIDFPETHDDPAVEVSYVAPTRESWRLGDRRTICMAYYLDGPRTGSLR